MGWSISSPKGAAKFSRVGQTRFLEFDNLKEMLKRFCFFLFLAMSLVAQGAFALMTELSVSYSQKKTTFDINNYYNTESITGSLSFYFMEKLAVELSYTDGTSVKEERVNSQQQTTVQKTQVTGADLIFVMASRKAVFQPFIKGGVAQITRKQTIKIQGILAETLQPDVATAPSYGVGGKLALTDSLGIKISYDVWKTPIGGGQTTDDNAIKAGLSWMF